MSLEELSTEFISFIVLTDCLLVPFIVLTAGTTMSNPSFLAIIYPRLRSSSAYLYGIIFYIFPFNELIYTLRYTSSRVLEIIRLAISGI